MQRIRTWLLGVTALMAISTAVGAQLILSNGMSAGGVAGQPDLYSPVRALGVALPEDDAFDRHQPSSDQTITAPSDMAFDPETGTLYVAESHGQRVIAKDVRGGLTNSPTLFVLGQGSFTSTVRNYVNPAVGCLDNPTASFPGPTNACNFYAPTAVAVIKLSTGKYLAVSDLLQHRVLFFNIGDANANGEPAQYVLGQSDFVTSASSTTTDERSFAPLSMSFEESSKTLIVGDHEGSRVLFFNLSAGISNHMAAVKVLGQPNFATSVPNNACGGVGPATPNQCGLYAPGKATWDPTEGALYLPTRSGVRVWRYGAGANLASAVVNGAPSTWIIGQPNYDQLPEIWGGGPYLKSAVSTAIDVAGRRLFVADGSNCRVVVYPLNNNAQTATQNGIAPTYVLGWSDLTHGDVDPGFDDAHSPALCGRVEFDYNAGTATWLAQPSSPTSMGYPKSVTYDAVYGRLFVADSALNRVVGFGSLVQGIPVQTSGGNSTTTPNPDGTTTAVVTTPGGNNFGVTFPPGTQPISGGTVITVTVSDGNGGSTKPAIAINATLPPGTTKSVTIPYASRDVCVNDVPGATIDVQGACNSPAVKVKKADLPTAGNCIVWRAPSDTMCRTTNATLVVNGLKNTALYYISDSDLDGVEDDQDVCPGTNLSGPIPTVSLKSNSVGDATLLRGGCNCSQILGFKPGNNQGEVKGGCTAGTVNVWNTSTGWAAGH